MQGMFSLGAVLVAAQFLTSLAPRTAEAYEAYLRPVDAQMTARAANPAPLNGNGTGISATSAGKEVKGGMIHDWTAATFVPGVRKARAIAVLEDFSRHASIYPEVMEGRVEKRSGNRITGFHRLRKKKVLEVKMEARYELERLPSPASRYASRTAATEIVELDDDKPLPPGRGHGFLWRLQTYWTVEETPQGIWMEVRSVTLTRDVPMGLGWAIRPMVRDLPRESLEDLLAATRKAIATAP